MATLPSFASTANVVTTRHPIDRAVLAEERHQQSALSLDVYKRQDQYRSRVAELESMVRELQKAAAALPPPAPAGNPDADRILAEMKGVATTAYDGINDALSELRLSIVMAQETWNKMERTYTDRDAARKLRDAIDETMTRADEAKGHVRSLRSLIE